MSGNKIYPVAIIGGGSAGTMAAMRSVLNNDQTLLFTGSPKDKKRSRAFWVSRIENMPGHLDYTKGIEHPNQKALQWLAQCSLKENFHHLKNRGITKLVKNKNIFQLTDHKGEEYQAHFVILATGVMDRWPQIGEDIEPILPYANVQLADCCLRCDGHHTYQKHTGVIGHSDGAAQVAIMLFERYQNPSMTIFTNGEDDQFKDSTLKLLTAYNIKTERQKIVAINGDAKNKLLRGFSLEDGKDCEVDICFVSLGMMVYNQLAKQLGADLDERGFVITSNKGQSSVKGLYVAGDLRANIKKQVYTAWDSAVDAADDINFYLRLAQRPL